MESTIIVNKELEKRIVYKKVRTGKDRIFSTKLSRYEKERVLALRAKHLEDGAEPYIEPLSTDVIKIAEEELRQGRIPFSIIRQNTDDPEVEIWALEELSYNIEQ